MNNLKSILIFLVICYAMQVEAQHQIRSSQIFLNAPSINPAFTGVDDFWEMKTGFRQQYAGLDNGPSSYFVGVYGVIKKPDPLSFQENSLRISNPSAYANEERAKGLRHGIGAMLYIDQQNAIDQQSLMLNYALHLSISRNYNLTVGTSFGLFTREINADELTVKQLADQTYQDLLDMGAKQSYIDVNLGLLLYSNKFYVGVSALPVVQNALSNSDAIQEEDTKINLNFMTGYQMDISPEWRLQSSAIVRYDEFNELNYELGVKFRKYDVFWTGLTYNSNEAISLIFGTMVKERMTFGYSYDFYYSDDNNVGKGNHEIILGIALFKNKRSKPYAW